MKLFRVPAGLTVRGLQRGTVVKQSREELVGGILMDNYQRYYRLAYSYVHSEQDALDIVQEGAYKAISRAHTLRSEEFAGTWIYRIMMNEAVNFVRKNRKEFTSVEEDMVSGEDVYQDIDLRKAIDALPEEEKALIVLRFFEDMTIEQVARVLNLNLSTAKSRLYRVLDKLKITLGEE